MAVAGPVALSGDPAELVLAHVQNTGMFDRWRQVIVAAMEESKTLEDLRAQALRLVRTKLTSLHRALPPEQELKRLLTETLVQSELPALLEQRVREILAQCG
eukprot:RCo034982